MVIAVPTDAPNEVHAPVKPAPATASGVKTLSDAEFWDVAKSKLIRYGGSWSDVRIVKAKGTEMWVSRLWIPGWWC